MKVKVKKLETIEGKPINPIIPTYGSKGAAGADLYSVNTISLQPGVPMLVHTGLCMEIPEGYEIQIRPRSGIALSDGITVLNTPGTVDEDYRGEVGVILIWSGADTDKNKFTVTHSHTTRIEDKRLFIPEGTRIAQAVLAKVEHAEYVEDDLNETERGEGGFGSTGA